MDPFPVSIVADDRERPSGIIDELSARGDVSLQVRRLDVGDFVVGECLVVERKTHADLAKSIVDSRLFRQAGVISSCTLRPVLIVEGDASDSGYGAHVTRDAIQGALITVGIFYGLAVLFARDTAETAALLVAMGRQAHRIEFGGLPRPGYRPKGKRARQMFILQGLPGIGPSRAQWLLDRFGSVKAVATAAPTELAAIEGIGQRTASRIRWALD